jgi:putative heme iron utilization protein
MNRDHADALVTYARGLGGAPEAEAATMVAVDRLGFRLRIRSGSRLHAERIPFPEEVRSADDARRVLIRMLQDLRAKA